MSAERDFPDLEDRITKMLHRRAEDVPADPDESIRPLPTPPPRPHHGGRPAGGSSPRRWALIAAAALLVIGGGVFTALQTVWEDRTDPAARVETSGGDDDSARTSSMGDGTEGVQGNAPRPDPDDPVLRASLDEVIASLPGSVDPRQGSTIWVDAPPVDDPGQAARAYLADRLPELTAGVVPVDDDQQLHLFRWTAKEPTGAGSDGTGGWIIVRLEPEGAAVVAATTDGVEVAALDRVDGRLVASIDDRLDGGAHADVTDLHGHPVPEAPASGLSGPPERRYGTAGSSGGAGRLDIDVAVPPWPVALRVQHVDDTGTTITELVLEPAAGFARSCGAEPPVRIEVGDRLGQLASGPLDGSSPPRPNQAVWHHAATEASKQTAVEIRWPPDPALVGRLPYASIGPGSWATVSTGVSADPEMRARLVSAETHAIIDVAGDEAADPCALVQLTVRGDPETADWWAGALSAEWSFDLPLTLATADLDPLAIVDADDPSAGELIVTTIEGVDPADVPRVPATGSCNGLPDDPPRTGPVPTTIFSEPGEALADFVATADVDPGPPLRSTGYEEYRPASGDDTRIYVAQDGGLVVTVIEIERAEGGGWQVSRWETAVC